MLTRPHYVLALIGITALLGACESNIRPMRPMQHVTTWVADDSASAATEPSTQAATQLAQTQPATESAPQPGMRKIVREIDPNQTVRFVYKANYDTIWQQSMNLISRMGFVLDRKDYRLGVLTTTPMPSAQIVEFWKREHASVKNAMENTINSQDRIIRLEIAKVPGKPDFYSIGVQVLVERETNPSEEIGGQAFIEGSAFGRNQADLRSDYDPSKKEVSRWVTIGHDPMLENKLLDQLFGHI